MNVPKKVQSLLNTVYPPSDANWTPTESQVAEAKLELGRTLVPSTHLVIDGKWYVSQGKCPSWGLPIRKCS